jgi:hypothetical protein
MALVPDQLTQPFLIDIPIGGIYPIPIEEANERLVQWDHKLGPCHRPFRQEAYGLLVDGKPIAIAISASIVNGPVAGYQRTEVVELARCAAANRWANRVMIRLWRELCAPRWKNWPVKAAVSYSKNSMHSGDLYRFDGWEKIREDAGSSGGGLWSRKREQGDAVYGSKTLWVWRYDGRQS